jgi:hypothetical protein
VTTFFASCDKTQKGEFMARTSVCVCVILLLVCGVVPALAQQPADQANEIRCSGGGATCKTGFVPKFGSNGGSATVNDSIMAQDTASDIKITGTETVTGNLSVGGNFGTSGTGTFDGGVAVGGGFSVGGGETVTGTNTFFGSQIFAPTWPAAALTFADDGVSGDLQPSLLVNSVDCCTYGDRMIWAHSPAFPNWGIFYDDSGFDGSADTMHWQRTTGTDAMSIEFETGNLNVTGAITAGVKDFKIDHPLDPQKKFLYHSSVESSEMMNIYTGNAILDNNGEGVISLPKWFEALNRDFRYQLTAIGAAAPNLHVAQEIANHQFSIAGGAAGMKVSWQVTGVRHDAYAKTHPLVVEVKKSEKERGHYLHPDAYGAPRLTQDQMLQKRPKP